MKVFYNTITGKIYGVIPNPSEQDAAYFAQNFADCAYTNIDSPILFTKEIVNYKVNLTDNSLELKA